MGILLESGARPYGSKRGVVISMVLHGGLIAAAVYATSKVVLPPREKVEEIMNHLAYYCGWPTALQGFKAIDGAWSPRRR